MKKGLFLCRKSAPTTPPYKEMIMSELKATPGPWKVVLNFKNRRLVAPEDPRFGMVAEVFEHSGGDEPETVEANAALIAAAPDMYQMLKELEEDMANVGGFHRTREKINEILAKARGEQ